MTDMRERIFRKADTIFLEEGGTAKGIILPKGGEDYEAVLDELAESRRYICMGDKDLRPGSCISNFMGRFMVLSCSRVAAFGKCFCSRSILEKVGDADE